MTVVGQKRTQTFSRAYLLLSERTGKVITKLRKVVNPIALRKAKIVYKFGLSDCKRGK